MRFPEYGAWLDGFLRPMVAHTYDALHDGGTFLLNIANVATARTLEDDALAIAKECGFTHGDTLQLILSSVAGKGIKTEPIFVLTKGAATHVVERRQTEELRLFDPTKFD